MNRSIRAGFAAAWPPPLGRRDRSRQRRLAFEALEPRLALAAMGLVPVGVQPQGGLSDKIAYIHGGHGYTAVSPGTGEFSFQRSEAAPGGVPTEMIEDLGNVDQMTFLADYLFRAGATVVPMRPVGHQANEVVLDNDDAGVTFVTLPGGATWSDSASSVYFGSVGDIPYKFASTALTETAYARYRPNIPVAGFYPIYAWTRSGSDRAIDQLYRVNHSGGITEVTINHRRVGNGLVYLGTYYFEAGTNGYVDISNRSSATGSVVIADMIRFGNGMGDINRGAGVSTLPREDEAGLYWIEWHVARSQGISTSEYRSAGVDDLDSTVGLSPRWAEFMNRELDGALKDRVFVSFHSNAAGGRGVVGLHNTMHGGTTPNQVLLAQSMAQEINDDLVAQNGVLNPDWFDRGTNVLFEHPDFNYGELNNFWINNEFDATIIEVAFHDNTSDAQLMREWYVRDAVARATYQGLIKYFRALPGDTTPATELPPPVTDVRGVSNAAGSVTISWTPPLTNDYTGGAPTGYRIYASSNGYGFDGGTPVAGGGTTTATLNGYDPALTYYFKVVAVNAGGESVGSEVVAVTPTGGTKQVLIVNGFDRNDRALNPRETLPAPDNTVDRVRVRGSNTRDYAVQVASAIHAVAPNLHISSTSNEAVISGAVNLTDYSTVVWVLGEESTADDTFNATEQTKVEQFIAGGGNLFVTGAEIGWDLDQQNNGRSFYETTLKGNYVADDANTYAVSGVASTIFSGLSFSFDNGALFYDSEFADVIIPQSGAQTGLNYSNGAGGAGIQVTGAGTRGNIVMFGFPFETITTAANREAVMDRVLDFFYPDADFNNNGIVDGADYVVWRDTKNLLVPRTTLGDADGDGLVNDTDYAIWREQFGTVPVALGSIPPAGSGAGQGAIALAASTSASSGSSESGSANGNEAVVEWDADVPALIAQIVSPRSAVQRFARPLFAMSTPSPNDRSELLGALAEHRLDRKLADSSPGAGRSETRIANINAGHSDLKNGCLAASKLGLRARTGL